ncbi:hypothetical protein P875_00053242 [Aspergillus parasiticus SU-1]|uniref:Protein kinase domain-containing protein n=1 Tax=Aspergillus parasiticus (strain ATCC 56775 / NRRL 5862 / SRRC 143 / SU-1) TaxID=1403190 RepID=A0A0F0I3M9_ASPPU|nr:hypothetical protein P875_00053242 [Aspergillus parasiticus SU-1]
MAHQEEKCPYVVGNTIKLRLGAPYDQQEITTKITRVFEPFTLSCAMVVLLDHPALGLTGHLVLKLFDRRFAAQLRKDHKFNPWTPEIERQYHDFILDGSASEFITRLNTDSKIAEEEGDTWNDPQNEAYLHDHMQDLYGTEVEAYQTLKDIQGKDIPQLFACLTAPSASLSQKPSVNKYIDVSGVLLQYIDGFLLTDIAAHAPREVWQSVCDEAIQIVNRIGDRGILNEDVKTRNFIVQENPGRKFKVFMIDFALCNFRSEYEDETDWWKWKAIQDEEGAVGYVMQKYLHGGFVYRRSARYKQLDWEFKRADVY